MFIQTTSIILREYSYFIDVGIGHITKCKINAAIAARDRHCTDRAFLRQFLDPVIITAS